MALQNHSFLDMFDLPFSNIAVEEYHNLEQLLNLHLQDSTNDSWHYHWGSTYSVSKAYATLMQSDHRPLAFQWTNDTKQCANSLGLQVKSVVARVIFPTRMTRGKYQTLGEPSKKLSSFSSGNLQNQLLVLHPQLHRVVVKHKVSE
jgi:hypothetical protein